MSARKPAEFACEEVFTAPKMLANWISFFFFLPCVVLSLFSGSVCVFVCLCVHSY